jgi:phospholipase C
MMENRSFDHLFGALAIDPDYPARDAVDGLNGTESNPDDNGGPVLVHRSPGILNHGPRHDWGAAHEAFGEGRNDGFVRINEGPDKLDAMAYHDRTELPLHYALADQYVVCDRWFSSVMGPTWPNRFFIHAGTSEGLTENKPIIDGPATIWEKLGKACWTSKAYAAGPVHWYYAGFRGRTIGGNDPMIAARIENFFQDARAGTLPNFSLIDPDFWSSDMHPPHSIALGEALLGSIVRSMQESPQWGRSMLIISYDEYGGFFDHVPPPTTVDPRPAFRQLGFRVPALVIGPTVRRGQVVSSTFEHVSIAATLRTRFGIESLGPRMDATADLSPCIDPELCGLPPGPVGKLPDVEVDRRRVMRASSRFTSQPGIDEAIRRGRIPAHLIDPRPRDERLSSLLRHAEELGVARVKG